MIRRSAPQRWLFPLVAAGVALPQSARACSVCFGDADSLMVKGAIMGAYFLVGVIGFVMLGVAGTSLFWLRRSRRLTTAGEQGGAGDS